MQLLNHRLLFSELPTSLSRPLFALANLPECFAAQLDLILLPPAASGGTLGPGTRSETAPLPGQICVAALAFPIRYCPRQVSVPTTVCWILGRVYLFHLSGWRDHWARFWKQPLFEKKNRASSIPGLRAFSSAAPARYHQFRANFGAWWFALVKFHSWLDFGLRLLHFAEQSVTPQPGVVGSASGSLYFSGPQLRSAPQFFFPFKLWFICSADPNLGFTGSAPQFRVEEYAFSCWTQLRDQISANSFLLANVFGLLTSLRAIHWAVFTF